MSEDALHPSKQTIVDRGSSIIMWLLSGPEVWETTPAPFLRAEDLGTSLAIAMTHPDTLNHPWIQTQKVVALTAVTILVNEMMDWAAANGRNDFFATIGELIEQAAGASD